ncbi:flagellar motor switch protein FliM [Lentibacillus salicampi]|uniref:Flagellar motor switch protein FliM n=1 Tax=Lentibacillus salicampi TaxID=175306 RepID=A0A4Y9AFU0_9BACI|nr:flagellar motor switch protein FliM [Lentibacillus salicampi]TFJ94673.1 flagellar motor switch protein FliM [Lentibacillus salicampi]
MVEEVLSQEEIDSLLSAISSGEMDAEELKQEEKEQKVRVYDFKRALRFSKDQIRSLSRVHENYARLLTTYFSAQLRTYVDISVASVDQIPYEEFIRSIPRMTILNIYSVQPLDGRILMEVSPNIAYGMLDRVLGGKGSSLNKVENLTEIETMLMSQLFEKAAVNLREAWSSVSEIDPVLEDFEVNPQFLQMVSPNETVIVVSLNTIVGDVNGMINICIPHMVLEPIIPKLSVHHWMQTTAKKRDAEAYQKLTHNIQQARVEAKTPLGETHINLRQLLNLNMGDCIALNQPIDRPLFLEINNEPKFYVQPGTFKNKMAVQVLDDLARGDDNG